MCTYIQSLRAAISCRAFCLLELIEDFSWLHVDLAAEELLPSIGSHDQCNQVLRRSLILDSGFSFLIGSCVYDGPSMILYMISVINSSALVNESPM